MTLARIDRLIIDETTQLKFSRTISMLLAVVALLCRQKAHLNQSCLGIYLSGRNRIGFGLYIALVLVAGQCLLRDCRNNCTIHYLLLA